MASHLVVVDSTARRCTIRTSPEKYLTEVLSEACQKLGRQTDAYILKSRNKSLDLSLTVRLSGLVNGAKLELVLSSRSPSAVSVALQLQQADSQDSRRLTDKLPSSASLWMILRHFESKDEKQNFTGRGATVSDASSLDSRRLYYETPVIQIMSREFSSFVDLQKTLAQLGFNNGSTLLRLSFRRTETPFEDALTHISQYFGEVQLKANVREDESSGESQPKTTENQAVPREISKEGSSPTSKPKEPREEVAESAVLQEGSDIDNGPSSITLLSDGLHTRSVTILAPPQSSTPQATQQVFDERDFVPTLDHAKSHQSRLSAAGMNKRLPSDAEIAAQVEAKNRRYEGVQEVEIKLRFPDQMQSVCQFSNEDDANALYDFVKSLLAYEKEPFYLRFSALGGPVTIPQGVQGNVKLIGGLGMTGRLLVNVVWQEGASIEARQAPVLKEIYRDKAQEMQVKPMDASGDEGLPRPPKQEVKPKEEKERKGGIPKWLKLPGRK